MLSVGCYSIPNPETAEHGQVTFVGNGDGDGDSTTGDGDGDSSTGDGDGDVDGEPGDGESGDGESGDGDPCNELAQTLCDGMCVNTDFDPFNCGDCGASCPDAHLCGFGECKPQKYVFATDARHTGNFLGLEAANQFCTLAAMTAQLPPGDYRAWLSDDQTSPSTTFVSDGVFRLRQGGVVAYSLDDLLDGNLAAPIDRTEHGEPLLPTPACIPSIDYAIWTGTAASGEDQQPDCDGWTSGGDVAVGRVGDATSVTETWSATDCLPLCNTLLPIYCVQQ
jgi:hypothetical protein